MTRFFIPSSQINGNQVVLEGSDHHHLLNVLRKKVNDQIIVLDGKGQEFLVRITELSPLKAVGEIVELIDKPTEPRVRITLVQSLPKADKFEYILQKNTELGVARFQPIISERSTIRINEESRMKKWERWHKIIKEAAEQSGRKVIPELEMVQNWKDALPRLRSGLVLIPWEGEKTRSLKAVLEAEKVVPEEVSLIIGSEGGFSLEEVKEAQARGAIPVTLGPRILRTETAGLVAATAILYHYGELGY
ncbi:MAG TPA: 16S rRNA (uracil(1498)-N(3))-methyltransferase [Bacillota bacterium]|jgi:16S rRNA (uracil1498-N3)-methyltransferase|nr:16S rRNA (uracil(1498)-N(3))-methyltransferase [Bacillota bacterium]HOL08805.1 16S rRNA (uracil(1498)-N(3))-methyltransferase [Bacillota bacterium]HPO96895.1 16S rRNA (uracil(1498)-N(3))-methyltransferase [Bacillota bacterium]